MVHKIPLSAMKAAGIEDVAAAVRRQSDEVKAFNEREAAVKKQKAMRPRPEWGDFANKKDPAKEFSAEMMKWNEENNKRLSSFPFPTNHPLISAAVDAKGAISYELVDDSPTPDQVLQTKKQALFEQVSIAEFEAKQKVMPVGKQRLMNLKRSDIYIEDEKRSNEQIEAINSSPEKARGAMNAALEHPDFHRKARDKKSNEFLDDFDAKRVAIEKIERWGAQLHSDIEDLTLDTIDAWTFKPYSD